VILGTGDQRYHERINNVRARFPKQIAAYSAIES
jgi:glycogen synthase